MVLLRGAWHAHDQPDSTVLKGDIAVDVIANKDQGFGNTLLQDAQTYSDIVLSTKCTRVWIAKGFDLPMLSRQVAQMILDVAARKKDKRYLTDFLKLRIDRSSVVASGAAVLLQTTHKNYVYVGNNVIKFRTSTPVQQFFAGIGLNDCPYPVAITDERAFFLHHSPRQPKISAKWSLPLKSLPEEARKQMLAFDFLTLHEYFFGLFSQARLVHLFDKTVKPPSERTDASLKSPSTARVPRNPVQKRAQPWPFTKIHER